MFENVHVRPNFKIWSKSDVTNYRPIAILSSLSLLFERLAYQQFENLLQKILVGSLVLEKDTQRLLNLR